MALVLAQAVGVLLEGAQTALRIVSGEVFAGDSVGLGERTGEEGGDCFERLHGQRQVMEFVEGGCWVGFEGGEEARERRGFGSRFELLGGVAA